GELGGQHIRLGRGIRVRESDPGRGDLRILRLAGGGLRFEFRARGSLVDLGRAQPCDRVGRRERVRGDGALREFENSGGWWHRPSSGSEIFKPDAAAARTSALPYRSSGLSWFPAPPTRHPPACRGKRGSLG